MMRWTWTASDAGTTSGLPFRMESEKLSISRVYMLPKSLERYGITLDELAGELNARRH